MKSIYFPLFILLILEILIVNNNYTFGSTITTIDGHCEELFVTSPCEGIIEYSSIYISNSTTQAAIEASVNQTFAGLEVLASPACKPLAKSFACLRNYPKCVLTNDTTPQVPLPSFPCRDVCESMWAECSSVITRKEPNFSCAQTFTDGDDQFPVAYTTYNMTGFGGTNDTEILCNGDSKSDGSDTVCLSILVPVNKSDGDRLYYFVNDYCALPCPFKVFTDSQQKAINGVIALHIASTVCSVFLIITFGLFSNQINIKNEIILYYCFSNIIFSLGYFIPQGVSEEFACSTVPGRYKTQRHDWICALCGVFLQFGALSMLFWFTSFSFDFFLTIRRRKNIYFKYQRIGIFVILAVLTLVPLITKQYETTLIGQTCWINNDNTLYQYVFFYVPSFIALFLMFFFTLVTVYRISKIFKVTPNRDILLYNIKMIIFITLVLSVYIMFLAFKLYTDKGLYIKIISDYLLCVAQNNGDASLCAEIKVPGFKLRYTTLVLTSSLGIVGLFGYGTDRSVRSVYRESNLIRKFYRCIGKEVSSTGSSSSISDQAAKRKSTIKMRRATMMGAGASSSNSNTSVDSSQAIASNIDSQSGDQSSASQQTSVENTPRQENTVQHVIIENPQPTSQQSEQAQL